MTAPNQNQEQPDPKPHGQQATGPDKAPNEGESAQDPAEGADDTNPPTEGSPRG